MLIFLTDRKLLGLELTRILSEAGLPVLMERPEAAEYLCRERTVGALLIEASRTPPPPVRSAIGCARNTASCRSC